MEVAGVRAAGRGRAPRAVVAAPAGGPRNPAGVFIECIKLMIHFLTLHSVKKCLIDTT